MTRHTQHTIGDAARHAPTRLVPAVAALALLLWPATPHAYNKTFSAGSLIIPAQMEYQTDCGMTSAYGLVYTILYKNAELLAAKKKPITIYWIIEPKKLSHHRCDTGTDALPDYSKYNDNDGCDLAVQSAAGQPVALLKPDNTEQAPFDVFSTAYNKSRGETTRTSPTPGTAIGATKKVVKYSGSFWIIDASDSAAALELFKSDPLVSKFRDGGSCGSIPVATAGSHHTAVHSARIGFSAPVARIMNVKPALIALLDAGAVNILQAYLKNAGLLDLPGAGGTTTTHGVIYDTLDPVMDFVSTPTHPLGALNMSDPADPTKGFYQVVWAPHWVSTNQSTTPGEADPGDDQLGDGKWTHRDPATGTYDDPVTNALKNIGAFADAGNGVFAECASIESFEGSYAQGTPACSGAYQCQCTDGTLCSTGDIQPLACDAGFTKSATCNNCYQCPSGYVLDDSVCNEVKCVSTTSPCPAGYDYSCGTCNACNTGWTLDTSGCPSQPATCKSGKKKVAPNTAPLATGTLTTQAPACGLPGYSKTCVPTPGSIDMEGNDATRFHATNRLQKNGLGNSFGGPDCTDDEVVGTKYRTASTITGDCLDFHPQTGGPATVFAQKGNFNYTGTGGHIHQYLPPANVGSFYQPGVLKFATSRNSGDASRDGWDFSTARHKDNDPAKGMVVYLAGHSYQNDVAGNRIVLNTMLNLGFSDAGVEIARSEPVGYIEKEWDPATQQLTAGSTTVFQGTYVQRQPPGVFQDWVNYNAAVPKAWRFPYTDGHFRAYPLGSLSESKQDFNQNAVWDAGARMPLPANRTIFTALGGSATAGWHAVSMRHNETDPSGCTNADGTLDDTGAPLCDLSEALATCATAGIPLSALKTGDAGGGKKKALGLFVQQVRGHCAAHERVSGDPIYEPSDNQCDDLKQQKNRAKLGGIDHSSPAIVGPSRYIPDELNANRSVKVAWSKRPVVAYAGGRDGMLHAIYVSGDPWTAEGKSLPSGTLAGTELWAFVPPAQLCGLATNSAMVDAAVNVVDVFGDFPKDRNLDGVIDLRPNAGERPDGLREWRTVLVAAAGEGGSEIFALDVTNPLRPVLLWHLAGASNKDGRWDFDRDGVFEGTDANGDGAFESGEIWETQMSPPQESWTRKWYDWNDGIAATAHIPSGHPNDFVSMTAAPETRTGRFDYRNMGYTWGTAVGQLWRGNTFAYVAYVATSAADWTDATAPMGYKGLEVFAIDLVDGHKLWQWENWYRRKNAAGTVIADNGIPGRPALVDMDMDGVVDRLYVGDMEGHMWELNARDGTNANFLPASGSAQDANASWCKSGLCSFPFFGTARMTGSGADPSLLDAFKLAGSSRLAQQPLTSPVGIGRLLTAPSALVPYLKNRIDVTQGTMGVDWSIAEYERGHVYVLPAHPATLGNVGTRLASPVDLSASPDPLVYGIVKPEAVWDITLDVGERVFGVPKIAGNDVFINTSFGSFTGDISETYLQGGSTRLVNVQGDTVVSSAGKSFGGVLVLGTDVVTTSASGIQRAKDKVEPPKTQAEAAAQKPFNRLTPLDLKSWEVHDSEAPPYLNP